nr:MAG TPA: hypothetical protein [Caudoviricetes sp.]
MSVSVGCESVKNKRGRAFGRAFGRAWKNEM